MNMDEIMSLEELCRYLKISRHTIYKLTHRCEIPSFIVGKQLRFRKSKIDEWMDQQEKSRQSKAIGRGQAVSAKARTRIHSKHAPNPKRGGYVLAER